MQTAADWQTARRQVSGLGGIGGAPRAGRGWTRARGRGGAASLGPSRLPGAPKPPQAGGPASLPELRSTHSPNPTPCLSLLPDGETGPRGTGRRVLTRDLQAASTTGRVEARGVQDP